MHILDIDRPWLCALGKCAPPPCDGEPYREMTFIPPGSETATPQGHPYVLAIMHYDYYVHCTENIRLLIKIT